MTRQWMLFAGLVAALFSACALLLLFLWKIASSIGACRRRPDP